MNKKGQYSSVTIGDLTGFVALLIVAAFIIIVEMQFRGWEKVTEQLESENYTSFREITKIRNEFVLLDNNYADEFEKVRTEILKKRTPVVNYEKAINNHEKAINHNADLYEQLLYGVREHVKSIHYGRPTQAEEDAQRKVRKALR